MNAEQERALVAKAQGGDRKALGLLWDGITPKLYGYLINVTRDAVLAEDLLQSTWLHAIEALPHFRIRQGIQISAWLFAIARNECRQHWRKSNWEIKPNPESDNEPQPEIAAPDNTHDTLLVEQVLSQLPRDDQELLRLRYLADLSFKDIAQLLSITSLTARVRLHRAIKRAQDIIFSQNL